VFYAREYLLRFLIRAAIHHEHSEPPVIGLCEDTFPAFPQQIAFSVTGNSNRYARRVHAGDPHQTQCTRAAPSQVGKAAGDMPLERRNKPISLDTIPDTGIATHELHLGI
jgi:hypothetical protein